MKDRTACIGLGSNLGDREGFLLEALRRLASRGEVKVEDVSSLYEPAPARVLDQPHFLNAAARLSTPLAPRDLLHALLGIEQDMGRVRIRKWGPRSIDLDLLLMGDIVLREPGLIVPHPFLPERAFVLAPLCDLNDAEVHPTLGKPLRELYKSLCGEALLSPVGRLNWNG